MINFDSYNYVRNASFRHKWRQFGWEEKAVDDILADLSKVSKKYLFSKFYSKYMVYEIFF